MKINMAEISSGDISPERRREIELEIDKRGKNEMKRIDELSKRIKEVYDPAIFKYLKTTPYKLAPGLNIALRKRSEGERFLSPRELDISARIGFELTKDSSVDFALMELDFLIIEGLVQTKEETPWRVRLRYNNGIAWLRRNSEQHARYSEAVAKLDDLSFKLTNLGLPLWENEKRNGLHEDLLCPEHISKDRFISEMKKNILIVNGG